MMVEKYLQSNIKCIGTQVIGIFTVLERGCLSSLTLSILTLSKVPFSDFLRNDYLDHFDTYFGENFDFDTFKNDTFESV